MTTINIPLLQEMLLAGYVKSQRHPTLSISIFNYTDKANYDRVWNEVTKMCRGLILDDDYNIVQRCIPKFHNIEEHDSAEIPNLPFKVYEKYDGSMLTTYWDGDVPYMASRGSFTSDQAIWGTKILHEKYPFAAERLMREYSYVWELLHPSNKIVCDYFGQEDIILLAVINIKTGEELKIGEEFARFKAAKKYNGITDLSILKSLEEPNKEGFVIKFSNGFRVKSKFTEYIRLHKIITQVSNVTIWEHLKEGKPLDELIDRVPDEFYTFVQEIVKNLQTQFNSIYGEAKMAFTFLEELPTRREMAEQIKKYKYASLMFMMLDGKEVDNVIWRMIRPEYERPFSTEYKNKVA